MNSLPTHRPIFVQSELAKIERELLLESLGTLDDTSWAKLSAKFRKPHCLGHLSRYTKPARTTNLLKLRPAVVGQIVLPFGSRLTQSALDVPATVFLVHFTAQSIASAALFVGAFIHPWNWVFLRSALLLPKQAHFLLKPHKLGLQPM